MKNLIRRIPGVKPLATRIRAAGRGSGHRRLLLKMLPRDSIGVEVGVHTGDFSFQILNVVKPRELHLIDPWQHEDSNTYRDAWYGGGAQGGQSEMDARHNAVCSRFNKEIRSGSVRVHRGYSGDILSGFADSYFDWTYIDGNHLYEFVKADLELCFRKTRSHGLITGDDYETIGWWQDGVKRAVDEFVENQPVELVSIRSNQFVLRKMG